MKKIIIGVAILIVIVLIFGSGSNNEPKYTIADLQTKEIFSEKLNPSQKYSYKNKALYQLLEHNLRGLNNLRTQEYLIIFKFGSQEIDFIPIKEGKTNSDKREKYKITFGGATETALSYGLVNSKGEKTVLSIESELDKKGTYIIKHVFKETDESYCKRGILQEL